MGPESDFNQKMCKYLRSATTKPTGKKRFEAGKKGKAVKARPIITMQEWLLEAAGKLATLSEATNHFGEPFSLCQRQVQSIWRNQFFLTSSLSATSILRY